MTKLIIALVALTISSFSFASQDSTGGYCEAKASVCEPDRAVSAANELPTPQQIDWENDPIFKHGGALPKNAK